MFGPFGGLPRQICKISPFIGTWTDSVCLRNVDTRAKLVPIFFEEVPSTSLSSLLENSKWDFVAKGGKRVPLPDFFLSSSPYVL